MREWDLEDQRVFFLLLVTTTVPVHVGFKSLCHSHLVLLLIDQIVLQIVLQYHVCLSACWPYSHHGGHKL